MYDRQWARSIVENYMKVRPRTHQINLCLRQLCIEASSREYLIIEIRDVLIDEVQGKTHSKIWPLYKRLVKRTPLDQELLVKVARMVQNKVDVDKIQRQFDFT